MKNDKMQCLLCAEAVNNMQQQLKRLAGLEDVIDDARKNKKEKERQAWYQQWKIRRPVHGQIVFDYSGNRWLVYHWGIGLWQLLYLEGEGHDFARGFRFRDWGPLTTYTTARGLMDTMEYKECTEIKYENSPDLLFKGLSGMLGVTNA